MAQAFICGLKSGLPPANPNALDTLTGEAIGGGVGALGMGGASATSSSSGTTQCTVQWPLQGTAALPVPPPAPAYTTVQHPLAPAYAPPPSEQKPSLDIMARQTAAGRRLPGLCCRPRPSARRLRSIPRCRRVLAAWGGEEAPAPERAQTVSAGRSRRTCWTSCASRTRPACWAPFTHTALHCISVHGP